MTRRRLHLPEDPAAPGVEAAVRMSARHVAYCRRKAAAATSRGLLVRRYYTWAQGMTWRFAGRTGPQFAEYTYRSGNASRSFEHAHQLAAYMVEEMSR